MFGILMLKVRSTLKMLEKSRQSKKKGMSVFNLRNIHFIITTEQAKLLRIIRLKLRTAEP